jgi:hypothetical protein
MRSINTNRNRRRRRSRPWSSRLRGTRLQCRLRSGIDGEHPQHGRRNESREDPARKQRDEEQRERADADPAERFGIGCRRNPRYKTPDDQRDDGHPDRVDEQRAEWLDPPGCRHQRGIPARRNQQAEPKPGYERDQDAW